MDPSSQGLLLMASIITLSLAVDTALRRRRTRRHYLFIFFSTNLAIWQLTFFLAHYLDDAIWARLSLVAAVLLPQGGLRFFQAFRGGEIGRESKLFRASLGIGAISLIFALSPWADTLLVRAAILAQAAGLMYAATARLHRRTRTAESKVDATRVRYLVFGGAVTISFSVADFLPAIGIPFPPIGIALTLIFMYVLAQSLQRDRLLDIYELAGRFAVLLLMGLTLAAMFTAYHYWSELSGQFFLNGVVAALVVLILFDPLRNKVEEKIQDFILRERWELERQIAATRADLWHVFEIEQIGKVVMDGLDRTRRVTHASLYIIANDGQQYLKVRSLGADIPSQLEYAAVRPLLDRMERDGVVMADDLARELAKSRERGDDHKAATTELAVEVMLLIHADVILPISTEVISLGLLALCDDRLSAEPYNVDDILAVTPLATQVGVAVQNSQYYAKMKERDRLAALGEMAAGLAHEIRNPLGSIKGAAQLLEEERKGQLIEGDDDEGAPDIDGDAGTTASEFLDVIIEETDRLNRVVSTFLEYARPFQGDPELLQVNDVILRTVQLDQASHDHEVAIDLELADGLPQVRGDAERLHQVFINLVRNAVEAMERKGTLRISTVAREARASRRGKLDVEVRFADTGPGIPEVVLGKIFIPFYTSKPEGTGLGLSICQRIVQDLGGDIEVESTSPETGTTFVITLPSAEETGESAITTTSQVFYRA
jgi:two-component system, NtrC family, sensor histidine kinase HydH